MRTEQEIREIITEFKFEKQFGGKHTDYAVGFVDALKWMLGEAEG